jgi:hypothetical protein
MPTDASNPPFPHNVIQQICQGTLTSVCHFALALSLRSDVAHVTVCNSPIAEDIQHITPSRTSAHTNDEPKPELALRNTDVLTCTTENAMSVDDNNKNASNNIQIGTTTANKKQRSHLTPKEREQQLMRQIQMYTQKR